MDALAWPAAVLILGFAFMLIFRSPIALLLGRIRKLGKGGLETFDSPRLPAPSDKPDPLEEFLGTYDNQLLRHNESVIEEELKQRGLTEAAASRKALLRSLAGTQILLYFERVQGLVLASHLSAAAYLNSQTDSVPGAELRPFYDDARERYPTLYQNYTFEQWVAFLKSWMLVDETAAGFVITMGGREFLKWRVEVGRAGPFYG